MGEPGRSHTETVLLEGQLWRALGQLGSRDRKPDSPNIKQEAELVLKSWCPHQKSPALCH